MPDIVYIESPSEVLYCTCREWFDRGPELLEESHLDGVLLTDLATIAQVRLPHWTDPAPDKVFACWTQFAPAPGSDFVHVWPFNVRTGWMLNPRLCLGRVSQVCLAWARQPGEKRYELPNVFRMVNPQAFGYFDIRNVPPYTQGVHWTPTAEQVAAAYPRGF